MEKKIVDKREREVDSFVEEERKEVVFEKASSSVVTEEEWFETESTSGAETQVGPATTAVATEGVAKADVIFVQEPALSAVSTDDVAKVELTGVTEAESPPTTILTEEMTKIESTDVSEAQVESAETEDFIVKMIQEKSAEIAETEDEFVTTGDLIEDIVEVKSTEIFTEQAVEMKLVDIVETQAESAPTEVPIEVLFRAKCTASEVSVTSESPDVGDAKPLLESTPIQQTCEELNRTVNINQTSFVMNNENCDKLPENIVDNPKSDILSDIQNIKRNEISMKLADFNVTDEDKYKEETGLLTYDESDKENQSLTNVETVSGIQSETDRISSYSDNIISHCSTNEKLLNLSDSDIEIIEANDESSVIIVTSEKSSRIIFENDLHNDEVISNFQNKACDRTFTGESNSNESNTESTNFRNVENNLIDLDHSSVIIVSSNDQSLREHTFEISENTESVPKTEISSPQNKTNQTQNCEDIKDPDVEPLNLENTKKCASIDRSLIVIEDSPQDGSSIKLMEDEADTNTSDVISISSSENDYDILEIDKEVKTEFVNQENETFVMGNPDINEPSLELTQTLCIVKDGKDSKSAIDRQNSTETDLVIALEALNINCDDKDETFLSCQENFEHSNIDDVSLVDEANETLSQDEINAETQDSTHDNCFFQNNQPEEKINNSINIRLEDVFKHEEEYSDQVVTCNAQEMIKSISEHSFVISKGDITNKEDGADKITIITSPASSNEQDVSSETVKLEDEVKVTVDNTTPAKPTLSVDTIVDSPEISIVNYSTLLRASPATFAEQVTKYEKQTDLKLHINELEQQVSELQIKLRQKERIILQLQRERLGAMKASEGGVEVLEVPQPSGNTEEGEEETLEAEKKVGELDDKYNKDMALLIEKVNAQETELAKYKDLEVKHRQTEKALKKCEQKNFEMIMEIETVYRDKQQAKLLLDEHDHIMTIFTEKYKDMQKEVAHLEKKNENLNTAYEQVTEKYELAKSVIHGLRSNEVMFKEEIEGLRQKEKRQIERLNSFRHQALVQVEMANKENYKLKQLLKQEQESKKPVSSHRKFYMDKHH